MRFYSYLDNSFKAPSQSVVQFERLNEINTNKLKFLIRKNTVVIIK